MIRVSNRLPVFNANTRGKSNSIERDFTPSTTKSQTLQFSGLASVRRRRSLFAPLAAIAAALGLLLAAQRHHGEFKVNGFSGPPFKIHGNGGLANLFEPETSGNYGTRAAQRFRYFQDGYEKSPEINAAMTQAFKDLAQGYPELLLKISDIQLRYTPSNTTGTPEGDANLQAFVREIIAQYDADRDGTLNQQELINHFGGNDTNDISTSLGEIYQEALDGDASKTVDAKEYGAYMLFTDDPLTYLQDAIKRHEGRDDLSREQRMELVHARKIIDDRPKGSKLDGQTLSPETTAANLIINALPFLSHDIIKTIHQGLN